jgi:ATP-dependent helicase HrpA
LPTERDIHEAMRSLKGCPAVRDRAVELLPLYASLPSAEQQRIFQPHEGRRIVLSTNVAESSLTVPGIRNVIDTGLARVSRYASRGKVQRLPIEAISQASADQRAGRCGRLGPGVCIRLYSEQDYLARDRYTTPEIRRASLAGPLLRCKTLGIGGLETLPLLDPPHRDLVRDGYRTLAELGALDGRGELTEIGRSLARLPVDPRIGRMVLAARDEGCLREVLVIAAALEIQDPRDRPAGEREAAEHAHARFRDSRSDFIGLLKLWRYYQQLKEQHGRSALRRACREARLSHARLREWSDVHKQLLKLLRWDGETNAAAVPAAVGAAKRAAAPAADLPAAELLAEPAEQVIAAKLMDSSSDTCANAATESNSSASTSTRSSTNTSAKTSADARLDEGSEVDAEWDVTAESSAVAEAGALAFDKRRYAALHRAILTGLLSGIAYRSESGEYVSAGGVKARLWPGAGPAGGGGARQPAWIVAVEIVETTRRYARTVAAIDPRWVEELAEHLVKRSYGEAQWWRPAGAVLVTERKTLFGLPISRRRVPLGPIDPVTAREMFLTEGLVGGDVDLNAAFFRNNQQLAADLARQAAKARRSDLAVNWRSLFDFYHQRLPVEVWDVASLHRWRRRAERDRPRILWMRREDLVGEAAPPVDESGFPDWFEVNELRLPLRYCFEPGQSDDGVTLVIPLEALGQVTAARVDWCVPALVPEKIERLIRSLPKSTRRILPPTDLAVARVAQRLRYGEGSFLVSVADALGDLAGRAIEPSEFQLEKLPHYLTMHLRVVDGAGQVVAEGRDIQRIWERLGVRSVPFRELPDPQWTRSGLVAWPTDLPGGALSESIQVSRGGIALPAFPTLIDRGEAVDLRLLDSRDEAARRLRRGLRRLFALASRALIEEQVEWLPGRPVWRETLAARVRPERLDSQLGDLIVDRAFLADRPWPRTEAAFRERLGEGRARLEAAVVEVVHAVAPLVETYDSLRRAFAGFSADRPPDAARDVGMQLDRLLARDFLTETPWEWLQQFPRYFRAARERLERVGTHADRDREATEELERLWMRYEERRARDRSRGRFDPELETYRWLLEEYRVSLFAQTMGTAVTISPRRLERQWERVAGGTRPPLADAAAPR